jgi:hypothetical protein
MGLLALDIAAHGVVMSADSQPVEILGGETRILDPDGSRTRNPIVIRQGGGFSGLVGSVGTERVGNVTTRDWLSAFSTSHPEETLAEFASALASGLTEAWQSHGLRSILEILIGGVEDHEVRFWYVRNSDGLNEGDWTYKPSRADFHAVDDLDTNYVPHDRQPGQTKEELLQTRMYSFRQGVLLPAAPVFNAFAAIMGAIYSHGIDGFESIASLDDLAYFARQRIEFLKRLYKTSHGIYKSASAPLGGEVHVFGVARDGEIRKYPKLRAQAKTIRPAPDSLP